MKNILSALKYLFKNILPMGLFALPAAIFLALKYNSTQFYHYILSIGNRENAALVEIYSNFSLLPSFNWIVILLWGILLILSFCLMFSYMEKHLKFGVKSILKAFKTVNYSVMAVAPAFFTVILLEELFAFLNSLFVKLMGLSQSNINGIILPLMYICLVLILFLIYSILTLWIPIKTVTGYSNRDSIRYSIRLTQGKQLGIMAGLFFPFVLLAPIMIGIKYISMIQPLNTVFYVLCYVFILGYLASYMMVTYFNLSDLVRKDGVKKIFK